MKDFLLLKKKASWVILFAIFSVCFIIILVADIFVKNRINKDAALALPFPVSKAASYPAGDLVLGASSLNISAEAAVVIDDNSKVVLFDKNATLHFSMASTTKIMTALVALDYYKMDDALTIKTDDIEGAIVGLKKTDKMLFEDLLYGMLLASGNDAAVVIAQNYPGGEEAFIKKMNGKAFNFHLFNTHFSDSTGLTDDGNYTTPLDLARLASIAIKNDTFARIVSTKYKVISDLDGRNIYSVVNLNKLLGIDGVDGIKTGFTDEALGVLVTSSVQKGHKIITVVMKSEDRFRDTEKLLNFISNNLTYLSIHP